MAHENETQRYNSGNGFLNIASIGGGGGGGGGGGSSKKQKQKKVPQRGLGVAQLEKIRLEEQQSKDALPLTLPPPPPPPPPLPLPLPLPRLPISPSPCPNLHAPAPKFQSFRSPVKQNTPQSSTNSNKDVTVTSKSSGIPLVNNNYVGWQWPVCCQGPTIDVPRIWPNYGKENFGVDPGPDFRSRFSNLPFDHSSNPTWRVPTLILQSPSSSMVNVSTSSSSSSVPDFQIEPPSNQSYCSSYVPVLPEKEKMVGMKRPYPFTLDNQQILPFHYKLPSIVINPGSGLDDLASFANGGTVNFHHRNPTFRGSPSSSNSLTMEPTNSTKTTINENGTNFDGDFLKLAPPSSSNHNINRPSTCSNFRDKEAFDFDSLPYQGNKGHRQILQARPSGPNYQQKQTYYSFLSPIAKQNSQATTMATNNCNKGEIEECVDLSLKL